MVIGEFRGWTVRLMRTAKGNEGGRKRIKRRDCTRKNTAGQASEREKRGGAPEAMEPLLSSLFSIFSLQKGCEVNVIRKIRP
jgi:hypothetical protein